MEVYVRELGEVILQLSSTLDCDTSSSSWFESIWQNNLFLKLIENHKHKMYETRLTMYSIKYEVQSCN